MLGVMGVSEGRGVIGIFGAILRVIGHLRAEISMKCERGSSKTARGRG